MGSPVDRHLPAVDVEPNRQTIDSGIKRRQHIGDRDPKPATVFFVKNDDYWLAGTIGERAQLVPSIFPLAEDERRRAVDHANRLPSG